MPILGFSALSKIKKIINSEFGSLEKTTNAVVSETINFSDINIGNYREVFISSLPENSVLLSSTLNVDTPFLDSNSKSPIFSLGVETDEVTQDEYPTTRNYKTLAFDSYALDSTASISYQGSTSSSGDNLLNSHPNNLVARFNMLNIWSAGGSLSTGRHEHGGCGSQTSSLVFGGFNAARLSSSEEYNGTSWTGGGSLSAIKDYLGSNGSQVSALCMGGHTTVAITTTEEYDGSTWALGGALNTARWGLKSIGTQTAALCFSGYNGTSWLTTTESYNGSAWTNENSLNIARREPGNAGSMSAGLCIAGEKNGTVLATCEEYNGSNWITANSILVSSNYSNGSAGHQLAASIFGGYNSSSINVATTQDYDGTNWSLSNNLNTARHALSGAGLSLGAIAVGGDPSLATTEEYNPSSLSGLIQGSLTLSVTYSYR